MELLSNWCFLSPPLRVRSRTAFLASPQPLAKTSACMIRRFFTSSAPSRKTVFRPSVTGHWLPVPSSKLDLRYGAFPPPAASAPLRVRRALRDEDALRKEGYVGLDSGEKAEVERKKKEAEAVRAAEASGQASTVKGKEKEKLVIQGVEIPNRPAPPGPEECCMSGATPPFLTP